MAEPLTLTEAKAQVRKLTNDEDTYITSLIVAARQWVENYTGHILVSRTFTDTFSAFGDYLSLRYRPVTALGDIDYFDDAGDAATYEAGVLRTHVYPAKVYPPFGDTFPTIAADTGISVEYTAGYSSASDVPDDLKHAMRLLIGHWYSHRSGVSADEVQEVPLAVKSLCAPYRVPPLA